jgi:predicted Zn-dependent protease
MRHLPFSSLLTGVIVGLLLGLSMYAWAETHPETAATDKPPKQSEEDRIGEKAAKEIEKTIKLVKDDPEIPRLEGIANEIAKYTQRPEVHYTVKVVDSKGINAFSIPGGRIYVTEGALKAVESKDELAAILAHEIAHNALRHAMQQQSRANHTEVGVMAAILAGVLSNRGEIALMAAQLQEGALNQYGRKAEFEADEQGVDYLSHTKYKPVAMLTVLEGLAAMEESGLRSDTITTGDTHPLARDRAARMEELLEEKGVNIEAQRRLVTERFKVATLEIEKDGGKLWQITLNDKPVFAPAAADGVLSPQQRAETYAANLRSAFNQGIQLIDVKLSPQGDSFFIRAREQILIKVLPGDAAFYKQSAQTLAEQAKKVIDLALYAEKVSRPF